MHITVHNTAQDISDNLPSYPRTIIIAQTLSTAGQGDTVPITQALWCQYQVTSKRFIADKKYQAMKRENDVEAYVRNGAVGNLTSKLHPRSEHGLSYQLHRQVKLHHTSHK